MKISGGAVIVNSQTIEPPKNRVETPLQSALFHDFEVAICGENKRTIKAAELLAQRLTSNFSMTYRVGLASGSEIPDVINRKTQFQNHDFVLVNGDKNLSIPKIIVLDESKGRNGVGGMNDQQNVIARVGIKESCVGSDQPYFNLYSELEIASFIEQFFKGKASQRQLLGLVLAGGESRRMKTDKALVRVEGQSLLQRSIKVLSPFVKEVFISARPGQRNQAQTDGVPVITDRLDGFGPFGGILSALLFRPQNPWLVIACDLPNLDPTTLERLLLNRCPLKHATVYISETDGLPEPLCAVYEPRSFTRLLEHLAIGDYGLRKMLMNSRIKELQNCHQNSLFNLNTPEDLQTLRNLQLPNAEKCKTQQSSLTTWKTQ